MYTIGQFSKICKVTVKALRHYDKIGLLTPAKVEGESQYRYYTNDQISLVKNISFMKELGIPLQTAKQMIKKIAEQQELESLLEEHRKFLLEQWELYNSRLVKLAWWEKSLKAQVMSDNFSYDIRLRDVQEIYVRSVRKKLASRGAELPDFIRMITDGIVSLVGGCVGPTIILHYDEEFNPKEVDLEVCWPVTNTSLANRTLPAVKAAACTHVGPYDGLEKAYRAIFKWINLQGFKAVYPIREISRNDPRVTPTEQLVTEIIIPIIPWNRIVSGTILCDDAYCIDPNCECRERFYIYRKTTFGLMRTSDSLPFKWIRIPGTAATYGKDGHSSDFEHN